jgi:CHAT domain-containing protein/tetratricopeptide (TPR) repeat protein
MTVRLPVLAALLSAVGCGSRDPPPAANASAFDSLIAQGEQIYRREEYDSARMVLRPVAEQARVAGDSIAEARALTWLGLAAWRLGDYTSAHAEQERALSLKLALGLEQELWRSYNGLGLVAWNEGQLAHALVRFAEATAAAERAGDTVGLGSTAGNVGLVQTELGDFAAARRGFDRMRDIGRITGNNRVEGNAHTNLGMLDIRVGNPHDALDHLAEALRLYQAVDYATGRQNALGHLGTAYAALGEPQRALAALDSALTQARALGVQQDEASDLEAIAEQHRVAGNYRQALELYAEAKAVNQELGLAVELGADLRSEAEIHAQLGDLDLAARYAREALDRHRAAHARFEELADRLLLADVSDRAGQHVKADAQLAAARSVARALDARIARVAVALGDARIGDRRREPRRVLSVLTGAAADLVEGGYDTEWEAYALRARAMARLGRLEEAAAEGRRALAAVERVRGSYGSGLLRTAYIADRVAVYAELATVLERLGRLDEAFEVSDAARGRGLLESMTSSGDSAGAPAVRAVEARATLLAQIEGLVDQVEQFTRRYDPADPRVAAGLAELYARLSRARGQYERLLAEAPADSVGAALLGASPTRAASVQNALRPDEALIEYLESADAVLGFVVTRERITLFRSPVTAENMRSRVRLARELLSQRLVGTADAPVLAALYAALIEPARLPPGVHRLIVVPQGALTYIPFAALRDSARGRYLAESYSVQYLPSAGALPDLRGRERGARRAGRAVVFAPFPDRLRATAGEAGVLRRSLRADAHVGRSATEARFRRALTQPGAVHAATHGVLNAHNPLFSRIEFVSRSQANPADDGRLEVHEVLDLRIASSLVFLSGCETGLGTAGSTDFARGEDFATLAQAFLYAGAGNVVATLWRVEDEGAAAFAERFYTHLAHLSPPEALAAAQRDLLAQERYRAPYHWGAYVLGGAGDTAGLAQSGRVVSVVPERQFVRPR